ncbi:hypothetical protein [Cetobacterium sp.]|uniref:hypothetical protein n=1 Tax=Cetobacterium sp. TaxID=2071632 RepID=UPI003F35CDCA
MRKYIFYLIIIVKSLLIYSFQIDSLNFDEIVLKNEVKSKKYTIFNNSNYIKEYDVKIEGDYPNIKISPSKFRLKPSEEKSIILNIKGEGKSGENIYFLVFSEKNLSAKQNNSVVVNKKIRIKQNYKL